MLCPGIVSLGDDPCFEPLVIKAVVERGCSSDREDTHSDEGDEDRERDSGR